MGKKVSSQAETPAAAKILVVDDEPTILETVDRLLTKRGYRVETTKSGTEAVEWVTLGHDYAVILLDLYMPYKAGKATYEEIVGLRPDFAPRIIFITGDAATPDTQVFLGRIGARYIAKPFNLDELVAAIQAVLKR